jgi:phospholipid transport system substrate-binding protein
MTSRLLAFALAGALSLTTAVVVHAGPPTDQLRGHVDRVITVLRDPELQKPARVADRRVAIRKVASDIFDFEEISRRTLARHWQARTPDERREFVGLMTDVLEQAYIGKIETYSGETVRFLGDTPDGDVATVKTKIVMKSGTEIPVDYRMIDRSGRWIAYDVYVEGVSLVGNYRGQFDRIIQRQSYPELVKALRAKQSDPKDRKAGAESATQSGSRAQSP